MAVHNSRNLIVRRVESRDATFNFSWRVIVHFFRVLTLKSRLIEQKSKRSGDVQSHNLF